MMKFGQVFDSSPTQPGESCTSICKIQYKSPFNTVGLYITCVSNSPTQTSKQELHPRCLRHRPRIQIV